jgi:hypothetical protein
MSKADDQKIAALVKKNAAKAAAAKKRQQRWIDQNLPPEPTDEDLATRDFFSEMKKREF